MGIKNLIIKFYLGNNSKKIVKYYSKKGVTFGKNFRCVTAPDFGAEPYLIEIGNDVFISSKVTFVTHDGGVAVINTLYETKYDKIGTIKLGNNIFLGRDCTIMPNVKIGNNVIIGLGSVVTKDIPDNEIWAGIPAKKICTIEEYYKKNKNSFIEIANLSYEEKKAIILKKYKTGGTF